MDICVTKREREAEKRADARGEKWKMFLSRCSTHAHASWADLLFVIRESFAFFLLSSYIFSSHVSAVLPFTVGSVYFGLDLPSEIC